MLCVIDVTRDKNMKWSSLLTCCLALIAVTGFAKEVTLKTGHPVQYVVQPGDTLWKIAAKFLNDPMDWPKIYHENPQVGQPSKIYPGEVLELQLVNGEPGIYLHGGGTIKLRPQVRSEPIDDAISVIPLEHIKPFLDGTRVVSEHQLDYAPYILAHEGEHVAAGAGDKIYVQGLSDGPTATEFWIYRQGKPYVDPTTKEVLGYAALHIGMAQLISPPEGKNEPATLLITNARKEVLKGDRLMPRSEDGELSQFEPHLPKHRIDGDIISVIDGVTQIGQFQVVVLDRGKASDLAVGDILAIYQSGKAVNNPVKNSSIRMIKLPDERAGELMIFRLFDKVSYGVILQATKPVHILDKVKTPEIS